MELGGLEPFGKANPKPVFADKNISIRNIRAIGKDKQYTRMTIAKDSGMVIDAVGFFLAQSLKPYIIKMAGYLVHTTRKLMNSEIRNRFRYV